MFKHTVNVWGWAEDEAGAAAAAKTLKQCLSQLNTHLEGKGWLVGGRLTLADIVVFNALIAPFNYLFDAGFRKAVPSAVAWFEKVSKLPFVARNAGFLKMMGAGKQQPATAAVGAQKQKGGKQEQPKKAGGKGKPAAKKEEEDDGDFDPFADDGEDDAAAAKEALEAKAAAAKKAKKPPTIAKSLVILEVKPWGPEEDLDVLGKKIVSEITMDGLSWKTEFKKEPVAYGVFKIIVGCVVEDAKVSVDELVETIQEKYEENVQSVDIAAFNKL